VSVERISISLSNSQAEKLRSLVESGQYPSVSAAVDAATDVLLEHEAEKQAWWQETIRRCEEAERHPERLLDADRFFKELWAEIADETSDK
jgi:Arc/MetJ-type ribon-helix-helix transcriptional regulator